MLNQKSIAVSHLSVVRRTLLVALSVFLLFVSAQFSIPWQPVPLTLQSITVLFLAMMMPRAEMLSALAAYVLLSAFGLPVLEGFSGGLSILFGATAGFIFGFFPAALVCNLACQEFQPKSFWAFFVIGALGLGIIFACGISVLALSVGWKSAYFFGLQPFWLTETAKLFLLAFVLRVVYRR